jgi:hypothetical protein
VGLKSFHNDSCPSGQGQTPEYYVERPKVCGENSVVFTLECKLSAAGLRNQGANDNPDCDPRTNAKSKIADRDANCASNRYAKTHARANEFAVFFFPQITHGIPCIKVKRPLLAGP